MSNPGIRRPVFAELTHRVTPTPAPVTESPATNPALDAVREGHRIARAIIARAEAQAQQIATTAREEGFEAGRRLAVEDVGGELRAAAHALETAAAKLADTRAHLLEALRAALPQAVVDVAAAILRRELSVRPDTLAHLVREAVEAVTPAARVDVRLHPEDVAAVERYREQLALALGGAELRLEAAAGVARGSCFVETERLTLAAGLAERVERALALLRGNDAAAGDAK
ncbi:MAG: hypothetical protein HY216_10495 [Candidatus Rokubacteria bacterium]|nr:hypothetical protein [Candidatus Rokubacteria bacterium]